MAANSASVGSAAVGLPPMTAITKIAAAEKILILTKVGCLGRTGGELVMAVVDPLVSL